MTDDIVARLRVYSKSTIEGGWATVFRADLHAAADEIERLRKERDELRREICGYSFQDAREVAQLRGWDCFKEDSHEH